MIRRFARRIRPVLPDILAGLAVIAGSIWLVLADLWGPR